MFTRDIQTSSAKTAIPAPQEDNALEPLRDLVLPDTIDPDTKIFRNLHPFDARGSVADDVLTKALSYQRSESPLKVRTGSGVSHLTEGGSALAGSLNGGELIIGEKDTKEIIAALKYATEKDVSAGCLGWLFISERIDSGLRHVTVLRNLQGDKSNRQELGDVLSGVSTPSIEVPGYSPRAIAPIFSRAPSISTLQKLQQVEGSEMISPAIILASPSEYRDLPQFNVLAISPQTLIQIGEHSDRIISNFRTVLAAFAKEVRSNEKVRVFHGKEWMKHEQELLLLMQRLSVDYFSNMYREQKSFLFGLFQRGVASSSETPNAKVTKEEVAAYAGRLSELRKSIFASASSPSASPHKGKNAHEASLAKPQVRPAPRPGETDKQALTNHRIRTFAEAAIEGIAQFVVERAIASGQVPTQKIALRPSSH